MWFVILLLVVLLIVFGPQLWVQQLMRRHHAAETYPGTGGQFAKHLLEKLNITNVTVEETDRGDHYDPEGKAVRLSSENFNRKSLTAITVAAHEVGHALQDYLGLGSFRWRTRLAYFAIHAERIGIGLMVFAPVIAAVTRVPAAGLVSVIAAALVLLSSVVVHLVTLPVEWDASFQRALPILHAGKYLNDGDEKAANQILSAAAMTYVAASLTSLLNVWRWLRILKAR